GMIIDDKWAEFLKNNNFLVGLSLDGTKEIHDSGRVDYSGKGTFNSVMKTVDLLDNYNVEYNILTVVNSMVARLIKKIYNFYKKSGFKYIQFIPCLDPLSEKPGGYSHSLSPDRFAYFLKTLFDAWYKDIKSGIRISIRYFDNLISMLMGYTPEKCGMTGVCSIQYVVESNGGVYPCDFYVIDRWYLGNLRDKSFAEIGYSETAKEFVNVSRHIDPKCKECKWLNLCRGGCRRHREPFIADMPGLNYFCPSYMEFLEYASPRLIELARLFTINMGRY
ncbi:MAG TPA: SPASM domain-containing protein, partial [Clostridiales bacterium]|nr:SPASM domain-containing protein [Clostridiales bacterium]